MFNVSLQLLNSDKGLILGLSVLAKEMRIFLGCCCFGLLQSGNHRNIFVMLCALLERISMDVERLFASPKLRARA